MTDGQPMCHSIYSIGREMVAPDGMVNDAATRQAIGRTLQAVLARAPRHPAGTGHEASLFVAQPAWVCCGPLDR